MITSILTAALLLGLMSMNVFAAEEYTYTVTFLAGAQGTFSGNDDLSVIGEGYSIERSADKITVKGLKAGDVVSFNAQKPGTVTLKEEGKYYVKGVRKGGRDNDTVEASAFKVTEDKDYVVAYGIKGNLTSYTVNYVDANGNALAESATYYGNVGDKPVVAYRYIDGYLPQAYGLTKTLSENAAENVFEFVYTMIEQEVVEVPGQGGTGQGGTGTGTGTGTDTPGTDEPGTDEPGTDTPGTEEPGTDTPGTDTPDTPSEPDDVIDLDDEETPGANIDVDGPSATMIGSIAIGVLAVIALVLLAVFAKKKKEQA